ncbi:MAG: autotransporter-associated beta strand repeat-containing protein [Pirellulales bacterium]|nr:autotransporter-associated beta strand repeat-containing protein [Pirellulales bacterium]
MIFNRKVLASGILSVAVFAATAALDAAVVTWTGGGAADFNDPAAWGSNPSLPAAGDEVDIYGATAANVTADFTNNPLGYIYVGTGSNAGTVNQSAGKLQFTGAFAASQSYQGTYNMTGGSIVKSNGAAGTFRVANFNSDAVGNSIGTMTMSGLGAGAATISLVNAPIAAGNSKGTTSTSIGRLTMNGDSRIETDNAFRVAAAGGTGVLIMNDNASIYRYNENNAHFNVGEGNGTLIMNGNSRINIRSGVFYIGGAAAAAAYASTSGATAMLNDNSYLETNNAFFTGGYGIAGNFTINGGTVYSKRHANTALAYAGPQGSYGVINMLDGKFIDYAAAAIGATAASSVAPIGVLNLNGGVFQTPAIITGSSTTAGALATLNLNGGILQANTDTGESPSSGLIYQASGGTGIPLLVNVMEGGAKIDTNGHFVSVMLPLNAPAGNGVFGPSDPKIIPMTAGGSYVGVPAVKITGGDGQGASAIAVMGTGANADKIDHLLLTSPGVNYSSAPTISILGSGSGAVVGSFNLSAVPTTGGLTKLGAGDLRLAAMNTYLGDTIVQEGQLTFSTGSSLPATNKIIVKNGAILSGSTINVLPVATAEAGATVAPGPGNLTQMGTLKIDSLDLKNNSRLRFKAQGGLMQETDYLFVQSSLTQTGTAVFDILPLSPGTGALPILPYFSNVVMGWTASVSTPLNLLPSVDSIFTSSVDIASTTANVTLGFTDLSGGNQWSGASSTAYSNPANWTGSSAPNGDNQRALLAGSSGGVVMLDNSLGGDLKLSTLMIDCPAPFTLNSDSAGYKLVLESSIAEKAQITMMQGNHVINADILMNDPALFNVYDAATYVQPRILLTPTNSLTVNGKVSGSQSLTHAGGGILELAGTGNDYTGATVILGGWLKAAKLDNGGLNSSIGKSSADPANLLLGGTLEYTGTADVVTDRGFTVYNPLGGFPSAMIKTGANLTIGGKIAVAGYNCALMLQTEPGKTLTFNNPNSDNVLAQGDVRVEQGRVVFDGGAASKYTIKLSAKTAASDPVFAGSANPSWLAVGDATAKQAVLEVKSGTIDVSGPVNIGQGNSDGSATVLEPELILSGGSASQPTTIDATYVEMGWNIGNISGFLVRPKLTMSGYSQIITHNSGTTCWFGESAGAEAIATLSDHAFLDSNGGIDMATAAGSSAVVTLNDSSILQSDIGATNIGNAGTATVNVNGSAVLRAVELDVGRANTGVGSLYLNGGTVSTNAATVVGGNGAGTTGAYGYVRINGGAYDHKVGNFVIGNYGVGVVDLIGGTLNVPTNGWYGNIANSSGCLNLAGGTANLSLISRVGNNAYGRINQSGGTLNLAADAYFDVGTVGTGVGLLNFTAGACTTAGGGTPSWILGNAGIGEMNVSGSAAVNNVYRITLGNAATTGSGVLNLGAVNNSAATDGVLAAGTLQKGAGAGVVNFHGGVLKGARASSTDWVKGLTAYVYKDGAKIDTAGYDNTIATTTLAAPTGQGLKTVTLGDFGSGYKSAPLVQIATTSGPGRGATAVAAVDLNPANPTFGQITGITITNPGVDYDATSALSFTFLGGGGTAPAAVPTIVLENNTSGGLTKMGAGILTLSLAPTYTGNTFVNEGTLTFGTPLSTPTAAVSVAVGATLNAPSIVANSLNIGVPMQAAAAVPEPGTLVLLALAGLGAVLAWRRK